MHCGLDKLNNFKAKVLKQIDLVAERETYTEIRYLNKNKKILGKMAQMLIK